MKAKALKKGDLIGVFSPSSYVEAEKVETARAFLESKGYRVFIHPQTLNRHHQSAGSDAEKLTALYDLLRDKKVKAIFAAGGGNFALHLLDDIDYKLVAKNPKILMGFSDVTALLNAFHAKTGLVTFHGPVLTWIPGQPKAMHDFNMGVLAGKTPSYPMAGARVLRAGKAEGKLIGGNL
ncbi:MAG: LD-carboxypeptidase, partial [Alphaproteobacteria bacterium]|nr:LD-carboxypeptidase [Alphaproteobacteria bacterium]